MEIECIINIDLEDVQKEYNNQHINNEKFYEYIATNISKSKLHYLLRIRN